MIINIRGTSGSGKSTLVRRIRQHYPVVARIMEDGRKQPISYIHSTREAQSHIRSLGVIGHYEADCGGCDTISSMDKIFGRVKQGDELGLNILFEGLLISADMKRTTELHDEGRQLLVVGLSTTIEECLASVNERRRARFERQGKPEQYTPVKEKNTVSKHKGVVNSIKKMQAHGMEAVWASRDEAFPLIMERLGWLVDNGVVRT